jgi:hypothetical protein
MYVFYIDMDREATLPASISPLVLRPLDKHWNDEEIVFNYKVNMIGSSKLII